MIQTLRKFWEITKNSLKKFEKLDKNLENFLEHTSIEKNNFKN